MAERAIQLILADNDGCIGPTKGTKVASEPDSDYALGRVLRYMATSPGLPAFAICTARPSAYVQGLVQRLGAYWPGVPSICEGGAVLYDPTTGIETYNARLTPSMRQNFRQAREELFALAEKEQAVIAPGRDWQVSLKPAKGKSKDELFATVVASFEKRSDLKIINAPGAIDISPVGIDKGVAIEQLAEMTGISTKNMLGIGDAEGDVPMRNKVRFFAGPANTTPELLEAGLDYVSPHKETRGVLDILGHFVPELKTSPVARYVDQDFMIERFA